MDGEDGVDGEDGENEADMDTSDDPTETMRKRKDKAN
jgi:hypothetical protein